MATTVSAKEQRQSAVDSVKREFIRRAAKKLFAERGLDATSVREIAREAGYTTGAIYFHYESKEALYADILRESLDRLFESVSTAAARCKDPLEGLGEAFRALVRFYDENPRDLDLSLYLLQGTQPRGLTPAANRDLNEQLMTTMSVYRSRLAELGVPANGLNIEVAGIFDEMIGALIAAHTGRLPLFGVDLDTMMEFHIRNRALRVSAPRKSPAVHGFSDTPAGVVTRAVRRRNP